MEDAFEKARQAVIEMQKSIPMIIKDTINEETEVLRKLQTKTQLFKGKDSKGESIVPYYTAYTIKIKKSKGDPYDRVTLADTGEFYDTLIIEGGEDSYEIKPSPNLQYGKELLEKYGAEILGIQQEIMEDFIRKFAFDKLKKNFDDLLTK